MLIPKIFETFLFKLRWQYALLLRRVKKLKNKYRLLEKNLKENPYKLIPNRKWVQKNPANFHFDLLKCRLNAIQHQVERSSESDQMKKERPNPYLLLHRYRPHDNEIDNDSDNERNNALIKE